MAVWRGCLRRHRRCWLLSASALLTTLIVMAALASLPGSQTPKSGGDHRRQRQEHLLGSDAKQVEYIDSNGVHVVVGKYVGSALDQPDQVQLSDAELNANRYDPHPGLGDNGDAVFLKQRDQALAKRLWHINQFNLLVSDRISVNRSLPDVRKESCQRATLPDVRALPDASVIIVFHNEAWSSLMRTVYSVINRSPGSLLRELILVDDASNRTFLHDDLDQYLKLHLQLPFQVIRSPGRIGLIQARLLGAARARGRVLVFLDAHCEATEGWLLPLLARVHQSPSSVVCPVIDIINDDNFSYVKSFALHWGGFNWELHFRWFTMANQVLQDFRKNDTAPFRTPVMAGGLFAIDKDFFHRIGSYDRDMNIWGGENLELSFRVWMCGGSVEIAPCSRVGHIFRKASPYTFPGGVSHVLHANLARLALVWMDDYAHFFFMVNPSAKDMSLTQNVTARQQLRTSLKCHTFQWYLDTVWPENFFPGPNRFYGKMKHRSSGTCLHKSGFNEATPPHSSQKKTWGSQARLQPCQDAFSNLQQVVMTKDGLVMTDESLCLDAPTAESESEASVRFVACTFLPRQLWKFHPESSLMVHTQSGKCLTHPSGGTSDPVILRDCNAKQKQEQMWTLVDEPWKL